MNYQTITFATEGPIATLTLNRPQVLNAFNATMVEEMGRVLNLVERSPETRALVLRGAGRAFCAGADLLQMEQALDSPPTLRAFLQRANTLFFRLEALPVPVVALVHGFCLAGGLELALACDLVLAAEDAQIGDQHANFGLMPGGGSTQRLPRKIGHQRAMELLLTGRRLSGAEAAQWGLVLRAVPAEALEAELEALLAPLADKSRPGLALIKKAVNEGRDLPLAQGVALESEAFVEYLTQWPQPREGIQAFKEHRQPRF